MKSKTHTTQHAYTNNKASPAGKCARPGIACTTTHYNASTQTTLTTYRSNNTPLYKHAEVHFGSAKQPRSNNATKLSLSNMHEYNNDVFAHMLW